MDKPLGIKRDTDRDVIRFKGILNSSIVSIQTNTLQAKEETQAIFSKIDKGAKKYFNSRNKINGEELDLKLLDQLDTENVLKASHMVLDSQPGGLIYLRKENIENGRTTKTPHVANIFNGLDLIVMNCNQVLENMQKGVYKDFSDTCNAALANFTTAFDEFKEQVSDMLSNINTVKSLKESVAKIASRWKIRIIDFMLD